MYQKGIFFHANPQKKWTFEFCLVPKFKFTTAYLVSQLADFTIGGIFSGPKFSQFRELTVLVTKLVRTNLPQSLSFLESPHSTPGGGPWPFCHSTPGGWAGPAQEMAATLANVRNYVRKRRILGMKQSLFEMTYLNRHVDRFLLLTFSVKMLTFIG